MNLARLHLANFALATLILAQAPLATASPGSAGAPHAEPASDDLGAAAVLRDWEGLFARIGLSSQPVGNGRMLVVAQGSRTLGRLAERAEQALAEFDRVAPPSVPFAERDALPGLVIQVASQADFSALLDHLSGQAPWLADWTRSMHGSSGFTLSDPPIAAWVDGGVGQEEWSSEHEAVHRVAELATLGGFGRLPYWVAQGLAWCVEVRVQESVYCFPYRNEFVPVEEHFDWDRQLQRPFKKRKRTSDMLTVDELASLRRGAYDQQQALVAWGAIEFLADESSVGLSSWLSGLAADREQNGKRRYDDGRWEWIVDYEVPLETQQALLTEQFGGDVLESMTEAFRKGRLR